MKIYKNEIVEFLKELKHDFKSSGICEMALFGSFARDSANIYSDIDIAIRKDEDYLQRYSAYDYFNLLNALKDSIAKRFHRKSDIFDLDSHSDLQDNIMKDMIYV